jgi:MYXO-CTERM domain-containing protein
MLEIQIIGIMHGVAQGPFAIATLALVALAGIGVAFAIRRRQSSASMTPQVRRSKKAQPET